MVTIIEEIYFTGALMRFLWIPTSAWFIHQSNRYGIGCIFFFIIVICTTFEIIRLGINTHFLPLIISCSCSSVLLSGFHFHPIHILFELRFDFFASHPIVQSFFGRLSFQYLWSAIFSGLHPLWFNRQPLLYGIHILRPWTESCLLWSM